MSKKWDTLNSWTGALVKFGVPREMCLLPGNDHGFDVNWGGGTQIGRAKIQGLLERYGGR